MHDATIGTGASTRSRYSRAPAENNSAASSLSPLFMTVRSNPAEKQPSLPVITRG